MFLAPLLGLLVPVEPAVREEAPPPNVVLFFADDLGWGDLGCFGARPSGTPHLDRMAREGVRLTSFYVSQAVCSASRASLLTGCYNGRVGIQGALGPDARIGLDEGETTLAEVLKGRGYATGIFGKWHLGHRPRFLPTRHGFDAFFGIPYSNDMWVDPRPGWEAKRDRWKVPLLIYDGERPVDTVASMEDQDALTSRITERAVRFVEANRDRPFLLYVPHPMPHVPLGASPRFRGRSARGLYGDVVSEIDASVGEVLEAIRRCDLDERTLVIFTSDNGPWLSYGEHAGSAGPLREGKGTMWEGGCRVPFVARWPGRIPAGLESDEVAATIDLLPTVARLVGADLPARPIDGKDISPLLFGEPGARSPHEAYFYTYGRELRAVRSGRWKLVFPHRYDTLAGMEGGRGGAFVPYEKAETGLALFDLEADVGEREDVAAAHPEIVERLRALAEKAREDLGDSLEGREGRGVRGPGREPEGPRPPNIVLVVVDDLGARDIGRRLYETPQIDRLAERGVRFSTAYSACTVCSPTRAAILTGQYPARLHLTDWIPGHERPDARLAVPNWLMELPRDVTTLAEALAAAGYVTGHIGKWHLGALPPQAHGFASNVGGDARGQPPTYFSPYRIPSIEDGPAGEYLTDRLGEEAARFVERNRDRPFFLHLAHYAVHTPLEAKEDSVRRAGEWLSYAMKHGWVRVNLRYAAMVKSVDESVGRLVEALEEAGVAEETVLVFTSDNGGFSHVAGGRSGVTDNFPLRLGKGSPYEGGVRVPLIVVWPGKAAAGGVSAEPVSSIDLFPTLLEIAGVAHRPVDGASLVRLLRDPSGGLGREALFWHYPHYHPGGATPYGAVRAGKWKLLEFYEDGRDELYDLEADRGEAWDLSAARADLAGALRARLAEWRESVGAQMPEVRR